MAQDRLTREAVEQILEAFPDPESGRSVMRMEQVHALHLSDDQLSVTLGLTTYSAPLWKETRRGWWNCCATVFRSCPR